MLRKDQAEMLDNPDLPADLVERAYRDIAVIHRWLGDERFMVSAIRRDRQPVRRILDVGCATGIVSARVGRRLGVEAIGVDIQPRPSVAAAVPIFQANACVDPLPAADVAFCMHLGHHLCHDDLIRLIRNVGRYCRRFILLDLVRHALPLTLFRLFVAPWICAIDAEDGRRSIRRAYTPEEMQGIATAALEGSGSSFRITVAPFYTRQVVDISYVGLETNSDPADEICTEEGEWVR